jgi:cytochrome oxidase assembly protein ShyY1
VYRFLATPRWLGFALLTMVLAATMVALGFWQLDRYTIRHRINTRIDQANATAPVPARDVLSLDHPVSDDHEWTRVTVTGTYDISGTVVARDRTVNDRVGFEILTPLRLADGSTVIVDRGWLAPSGDSATDPPAIPALPAGPVVVTGRVHQPESRADPPVELGGATTVRRIDPARLANKVGDTPLYRDYVLLDTQSPAGAGNFVAISADREPAWLNAGYTVQWWAFALLSFIGYGWAARREAHDRRDGVTRTKTRASPAGGRRPPRDRLADDTSVAPLL